MNDAERRAMARDTIAKATRLRRFRLPLKRPVTAELSARELEKVAAAEAKRTKRAKRNKGSVS